MPLPPRPIDATLHGVTDYTAGATLMTVFPRLAGIEGTRVGAPDPRRRARSTPATARSPTTRSGVVKVLPYQAHLALDALGAVALAATPFVTGQYRKGRSQWVPHVGAVRCSSSPRWRSPTRPAAATTTATSTRSAGPTRRTRTARSTTARAAVRPAAAAT